MTPIPNSGPHIAKLQERIELLEAELADMKATLGVDHERHWLRLLGLTEQEAGIVGVLLKREIATNAQILVGANPTDMERRYTMTARTVKIPLHHAKAKLKRHGVEIQNIHSRGYHMPPESKARLNTAINAMKQA